MTRRIMTAIALTFLALPSYAFAADVTASITLQRGHIISSGDIAIAPDHAGNGDALKQQFIGQQMRRTIYAGARLSPAHVDRPTLVRRNSRVNMIYRLGRLEMSASGRSLDEGGAGDIISVMNLDSKLRVQGEILPDGSIEVIK